MTDIKAHGDDFTFVFEGMADYEDYEGDGWPDLLPFEGLCQAKCYKVVGKKKEDGDNTVVLHFRVDDPNLADGEGNGAHLLKHVAVEGLRSDKKYKIITLAEAFRSSGTELKVVKSLDNVKMTVTKLAQKLVGRHFYLDVEDSEDPESGRVTSSVENFVLKDRWETASTAGVARQFRSRVAESGGGAERLGGGGKPSGEPVNGESTVTAPAPESEAASAADAI